MVSKANTPAIKWLQANGLAFELLPYAYVERGGASHSAKVLGLAAASVVKTLIMQDEAGKPLVVLMHGNQDVATKALATKALAKAIGRKLVQPCLPEVANKHSGYLVGGTSPFGLRKDMPVFVEATVLELPVMAINAGQRGLLVRLPPKPCLTLLGAVPVSCAQARNSA
jgi:Cys-tRNA(Pro) deacylase